MKTQPAFDADLFGLCGGSQAGWIMPIVASLTKELAFIISISGAAVATHEQEGYRIERQLRVDSFTEQQIDHALGVYARRLEMIRQGAAVEDIMAMQNEVRDEPWHPYLADTTPEDLEFFIANYLFDPVPYLRKVTCPFLGIWGELDTYVPVEKSIRITRQALEEAGNPCFQLIVIPKTSHGMRLAETGSPNEQGKDFVPAFWESMTDWLPRTIGPL
jgi:pimeloyl-ACP methyl ester carboxylesterase